MKKIIILSLTAAIFGAACGNQSKTSAAADSAKTSAAASGTPKAQAAAAAPATTYDVFLPIRNLAQLYHMDCWATALTILYSWKNHDNTITAKDLVARYGAPYTIYYDTDAGIMAPEELKLYQKAGVSVIQGANPTIPAWYSLLKDHGPLSVTVGVTFTNGHRGIHALVLNGLKGDGTAANTFVDYVDPDGGQPHHISWTTFLRLFQGGAPYSVQVVYWP